MERSRLEAMGEREKIIFGLERLAEDMLSISSRMEAFDDSIVRSHGRELRHAAQIAEGWATGMAEGEVHGE